MTDFEFKILEILYTDPDNIMERHILANSFGKLCTEADEIIGEMIEDRYLNQSHGSRNVKIIKKGKQAYRSEKEKREKEAKENAAKDAEKQANALETDKNLKKQFRHDFIIAVVSSVSGSLLTLLIEHFPKIIKAVITFLE